MCDPQRLRTTASDRWTTGTQTDGQGHERARAASLYFPSTSFLRGPGGVTHLGTPCMCLPQVRQQQLLFADNILSLVRDTSSVLHRMQGQGSVNGSAGLVGANAKGKHLHMLSKDTTIFPMSSMHGYRTHRCG